MFEIYIKTFFKYVLRYLFFYGILVFLGYVIFEDKFIEWFLIPNVLVPLFIILIFLSSYKTHLDIERPIREKYQCEISEVKKDLAQVLERKEFAEKDAQVWKSSVLERSSGFPTLVETIQNYEKLKDQYLEKYLFDKKHPAKKASGIIKEESARRRKAEFEAKTTKGILDYYESLAPFLIDLKNDIIDSKQDESIFRDYDEIERQDPVTNYLTKEEYRKLSATERNQLALDRFWDRKKSKKLIGRLYERYVGYLYEKKGYQVDYIGIFKGFEDLGRDLICKKGNDLIIIQCKYWSHFKTIYEKHIFQFFGTVFQYRDSFPLQNVHAIFYTSTQLSDLARRFANDLKIELKEKFKFDKSYPCIKCNINTSTKEKIYHLPFDQQYDRTKIVNDGEFYSPTVKIAEGAGFRRAFRWHGKNEK